jgi:hypothetical protein
METKYLEEPLPPHVKTKTIDILKNHSLLQGVSRMPLSGAIISFMAIGLFGAGWFSHQYIPDDMTGMAKAGRQQYILLLHNPPGYTEDASRAIEYGTWLSQLRMSDPFVSGNELDQKGWDFGFESSQSPDPVSGYFLIQASSDEEAQAIALSCPHVKYHGSVALRRIITH